MANQEALVSYLGDYIANLTRDEGEMVFSEDGYATKDEWFKARRPPESKLILPAWERQDDLVEKLSMLLAKGDDFRNVIDSRHVLDAIALTDWVIRRIPKMVEHAYRTPASADMNFVIDWFEDRALRWVPRAAVMRAMSPRGITKQTLDPILATIRISNPAANPCRAKTISSS